MKAINLIKNNIFTLLNSGCSNNEIYEAIKELEDMEEKMIELSDSYEMLKIKYKELNKNPDTICKADHTNIKQ